MGSKDIEEAKSGRLGDHLKVGGKGDSMKGPTLTQRFVCKCFIKEVLLSGNSRTGKGRKLPSVLLGKIPQRVCCPDHMGEF